MEPRGANVPAPDASREVNAESAERHSLGRLLFCGFFPAERQPLMSLALKRLACAATLLGIVAACDTSPPTGPMPQARVDNAATTIAGPLIAFASTRTADLFQTFVMKANGTKISQLTYQPFYNARPDWSRDGSRITFTACRAGDDSCEVYVMNADGSGQTNLTRNFALDHMSVWSPDGKKIAFVSDRDGNEEIYVM